MSELFFIYNGKLYLADTPIISSSNRSLRYGDGLFETMKLVNGEILNKEFHFDRLFKGLHLLQFEIPPFFSKEVIEKKIVELVSKNKQENAARVRFMIFRGNGGVFDPENLKPNYIIESWPLTIPQHLNENGLVVDIFPDARKSCDIFSNIKSNNYLPYILAGLYAKKNKLNDCLVLNSHERLSDSVISNIFLIKEKIIFTPPLSEGCVAGVMRRWFLERFDLKPFRVVEKELTEQDLFDAEEFFLTNAIYQVRWVKSFRDKNYANKNIRDIYSYTTNHFVRNDVT